MKRLLILTFMIVAASMNTAAAETLLYLANPLGFAEAGRHFKDEKLKPELRKLGLQIIDPWELPDAERLKSILAMPFGAEKRAAWEKFNPVIAQRNQTEIDRADAVFAVLDGVDVDSGTAAEIGYAFAKRKIIVGYRGDFRLSADNEGSVVNLQVEYFIRASGGTIISSISELKPELFRSRSDSK